jgi:hypothetical protein
MIEKILEIIIKQEPKVRQVHKVYKDPLKQMEPM